MVQRATVVCVFAGVSPASGGLMESTDPDLSLLPFPKILAYPMNRGIKLLSVFSISDASGYFKDLAADGFFRKDFSFPFDPGSDGLADFGWI